MPKKTSNWCSCFVLHKYLSVKPTGWLFSFRHRKPSGFFGSLSEPKKVFGIKLGNFGHTRHFNQLFFQKTALLQYKFVFLDVLILTHSWEWDNCFAVPSFFSPVPMETNFPVEKINVIRFVIQFSVSFSISGVRIGLAPVLAPKVWGV